MRIPHIDNIMTRCYGNTKVATGRKLFNGLIRNNHKELEFSDRDIAHFEAPLNIKPLELRRSFLNGWAGFIGSVTMAYYVFLKYAKLYEAEQFAKYGDSLLPGNSDAGSPNEGRSPSNII